MNDSIVEKIVAKAKGYGFDITVRTKVIIERWLMGVVEQGGVCSHCGMTGPRRISPVEEPVCIRCVDYVKEHREFPPSIGKWAYVPGLLFWSFFFLFAFYIALKQG